MRQICGVGSRWVTLLRIGFVSLSLVVISCANFQSKPAVSLLKESTPLVQSGTPLPLSGTQITADTVNRIELLTRWGKGTASFIAWSPDARLLAIAGSYGIYLFDVNTLAQLRHIAEPTWVGKVLFSRDGRWLASVNNAKTAQVWRVSDGNLVHEIKDSMALGFGSNGTLATAGTDHTIRVWQVSDWTLSNEFKLQSPNNRFALGLTLFSPDATIVVGMGQSMPPASTTALYVWRLSDGKYVRELTPADGIYAAEKIAFSADASVLALTSAIGFPRDGAEVRVWRMSDGTLANQWNEDYRVFDIAFSPDSRRLLLSGSGTSRTRQVSDSQLVHELQASPGISLAAYSPSGTRIAAVFANRVRLLRADDLNFIGELQDWHPMTRAAFNAQGDLIATTNDADTVLWRANDGSFVREIKDEFWTGSVFSPDGMLFASQNRDGVLHLWRVRDGSLARELNLKLAPDKDARTLSIQLGPDWIIAATLSAGSSPPWPATLRLFRLSDGKMVRELSGAPLDGVFKFVFSPDGSKIATVGGSAGSYSVRVWDVDNDALAQEISESYVDNVAFRPDSGLIALSGGSSVRIHEVSNGKLVRELKTAASNVYGMAFSPDGNLFAAGSDDSVIRLWRASDWSLLRELKGQRFSIVNLTFRPDSNLLASGSWDSTLGLWGIPAAR